MTDIFDMRILCKKCNAEMKPKVFEKNGLQLRAIECPRCKDKIIHPADLNCMNRYNDLKGKTYNVKLRMVGNSHAVSIPKEIVDLINEQHRLMSEQHKRMNREMEDFVKLAFEDFGKLRLTFWDEEDSEELEEEDGR
jgi:DNA-directed RNA polymerase subunit RPC12/RpoP